VAADDDDDDDEEEEEELFGFAMTPSSKMSPVSVAMP
jgi:hypothetical protein